MQAMDRQYLDTPCYGSRRMKVWLAREGRCVSRKRVQRLMRIRGLPAIYRSPRTSQPAPAHRVYPYLLEKIRVTRPNQAWPADITYLPMARGFLYLVAIMDWHSRYVVASRLSNTLEADCCVDALQEALGQGQPEICNTDQGCQFTSLEFTQALQEHGVKISRDGKGRYTDNILEPVYNLFRISTVKASTTICRLVLSFLSQFFQSRRHFSSQAKDRSTTHRFGSTTKVCSSLRFTTSTAAPNRPCTAVAKGFPV